MPKSNRKVPTRLSPVVEMYLDALNRGLITNNSPEETYKLLLDALLPYSLTETEKDSLKASFHLTSNRCKDPHQLVIKRTWVINFINNRIKPNLSNDDYYSLKLDESSVNALVALTSKQSKTILTIGGASRFKYLLPQGLFLTIAYYRDHQDCLPKVHEIAQLSSIKGLATHQREAKHTPKNRSHRQPRIAGYISKQLAIAM